MDRRENRRENRKGSAPRRVAKRAPQNRRLGTLILLLALMIAVPAAGQIIEGGNRSDGITRSLSYQGYLVDDRGKPVADRAHHIVFRLYDRPDASRPVYEELRLVETSGGLFSTEIGPIPSTVDFSGSLWIAVVVGGKPEMARTMLMPSPYAIHATTASSLDDDAPLVRRVAELERLVRELVERAEPE